MSKPFRPTSLAMPRRRFLQSSGLLAGAAGLAALAGPGTALGQGFPSRNLEIVIPTGVGGGADRDARAFTQVWGRHLDTNFEFGYYPGAAGQVGYEFYMNREPDAHSVLFAYLGPEVIMLELQDTGIEIGRDIVYIQQTLSEPMAVWVGPNSPFQSIEQLVEEARRRPVTVSVSRLPHPASIGMLALGEELGVEFVLVPYGGGNPSAMAAITMEVDCCALPITNTIVLDDQARVLGVFADSNPTPAETDDAPTINAAFGTAIPPLSSSRAWGIHRAAYDAYPERVQILKDSMAATLADPSYPDVVAGTGVPTAFIDAGDEAVAMATAESMRTLARRFRGLLSGS